MGQRYPLPPLLVNVVGEPMNALKLEKEKIGKFRSDEVYFN